MDWKSGLKSAAKSTAGDFMSQFFDSDKPPSCEIVSAVHGALVSTACAV